MSNAGQNIIVGAVGSKGYGKSHYIAERIQLDSPRFVYFDTMHQYDPRAEKVPLVTTCKAAGGYMLRQRDALCFRLMLQPDFNENTRLSQLEWLCKIAFHVGHCAVLVDEIDRFCSPTYLPENLGKLVDYGRLVEVSLYWSARRFAAVSRTLTSQTDELALFNQTEPADVDAVAKRNREAAELVKTLQPRQALILKKDSTTLERYGEWSARSASPQSTVETSEE